MPTAPTRATAERYLTRQEAAEFLGLKPQTLNNWATTRKHLPVYKIGGRCVRYKLSDLQRFMEKRCLVPASE